MALAYKYRIPYKTKKEKEEADLFLKLENKFRNPSLQRRLRANGRRKQHALKDGLSPRGMIKTFLVNMLKNGDFTQR